MAAAAEVSKYYKGIYQPSESPAIEVAVVMSMFESIQKVAVTKNMFGGILNETGDPVKGHHNIAVWVSGNVFQKGLSHHHTSGLSKSAGWDLPPRECLEEKELIKRKW